MECWDTVLVTWGITTKNFGGFSHNNDYSAPVLGRFSIWSKAEVSWIVFWLGTLAQKVFDCLKWASAVENNGEFVPVGLAGSFLLRTFEHLTLQDTGLHPRYKNIKAEKSTINWQFHLDCPEITHELTVAHWIWFQAEKEVPGGWGFFELGR